MLVRSGSGRAKQASGDVVLDCCCIIEQRKVLIFSTGSRALLDSLGSMLPATVVTTAAATASGVRFVSNCPSWWGSHLLTRARILFFFFVLF